MKHIALLGLSALLLWVRPAAADTPGSHPHYVHAMSDLRHARWLLNHPNEWNVHHEERDAMRDVDLALNDITQAAVDDAKNVQTNFPEDAPLDVRGRMGRARELLQSALSDLDYNEDNPAALGWRAGAVSHVEHALGHLNRAWRIQHWDNH